MFNLQRGFDAKDITGFFACHRSVCLLIFFSNAVKSYVFSRKKEESIKGMLNLQRGFDAKDITGFFACHRSVFLLVSFLMQ
jgi:hypothetical protein